MTFPERLRALRKRRKIVLKELVTHLGENLDPNEKPNTTSQVDDWEHGIRTPSYVEARKLAEFFDASLDYLTRKTDRDDFGLAKLFFSSKDLSFDQTIFSSGNRYEIFQLIDGYLKGRHNRRDTDTFYGKQEQLSLKLK